MWSLSQVQPGLTILKGEGNAWVVAEIMRPECNNSRLEYHELSDISVSAPFMYSNERGGPT